MLEPLLNVLWKFGLFVGFWVLIVVSFLAYSWINNTCCRALVRTVTPQDGPKHEDIFVPSKWERYRGPLIVLSLDPIGYYLATMYKESALRWVKEEHFELFLALFQMWLVVNTLVYVLAAFTNAPFLPRTAIQPGLKVSSSSSATSSSVDAKSNKLRNRKQAAAAIAQAASGSLDPNESPEMLQALADGRTCKWCARKHNIPETWCPKPETVSHCRYCDECVAEQDHHCIWLGRCVGDSNYRYFFGFLVTQIIFCLFGMTVFFAHLFNYWDRVGLMVSSGSVSEIAASLVAIEFPGKDYTLWLPYVKYMAQKLYYKVVPAVVHDNPAVVAYTIITTLALVFVGVLFVVHTSFIFRKTSTKQYLKGPADIKASKKGAAGKSKATPNLEGMSFDQSNMAEAIQMLKERQNAAKQPAAVQPAHPLANAHVHGANCKH